MTATAPGAQPLTLGPALTLSPERTSKWPPRHLADLDPAERKAAVAELGEKPFRARQLAVHYFQHLQSDPEQMTDLPAAGRTRLVEALLPQLITPVRRLECDGGSTVKYAWRLFDGAVVESLLMRFHDRASLCVSSQAGCGMGCTFCATGQAGLTRNLTVAEIVEQVVAAARELAGGPEPTRLSHVVFMGMGEPLANLPFLLKSLHRLCDPAPDGLGLSARNVTVSTVGLVPFMDRLAGHGMPVTLALSLHAPDDELRDELVPINQRFTVAATLDAARRYFDTTGRRVSIEYALIGGVNDQAWRADLLGRLLTARGKGWVHVNPIPLNPIPGSPWQASEQHTMDIFVEKLLSHGIPTTIRHSRGREIDGACGQMAVTEGRRRRPAVT